MVVVFALLLIAACKKEDRPSTQNLVGDFWMTKDAPGGSGYELSVIFFPDEPGAEYRGPSIVVDSVSANGRSLTTDAYGVYVLPGLDSSLFQQPIIWRIAGANNISSMNYTDSLDFAQFNLAVPSIVDKTKGLSISLSPLSRLDTAWVYVSNDSGVLTLPLSKANWTTTIAPSDLSKYNSGDKVRIEARGLVRDSVVVSNVRFRFFRQSIKAASVNVL